MKTETCKLYSRVFWIYLPNFIKIDPYNFELYRFKVGAFFETQYIWFLTAFADTIDREHQSLLITAQHSKLYRKYSISLVEMEV